MKLWTLLENTSCREDLTPEHGLSLYLETGTRRILFDSGQSGTFADNAKKMGIDLSRVDTVILSHGHYDHGGGLLRFLGQNHTASIYASPRCFGDFYNGREKYIGLDPALKVSNRFVPVTTPTDLGDGLILIPASQLPTPYPVNSYGLNVREQGCFRPDDFLHEQYLLLKETDKTILLSGCSHRGILNIATYFHPDVLIGGFHFKKLDPQGDGEPILSQAAQTLLRLPTVYYTGHCTGAAQYEFLKEKMGDRLFYLSTGSKLSL